MYGIATVIDICTGLVIDYVVLSKYCHACTIKESELGVDSAEFNTWYDNHNDDCAINYVGSSNAMEMEAASRLWSHSEVLGLSYAGFLSDGDSKAFKAVSDLNIYNEPIVKEECVNHVHKRMSTALRHLSKSKRLGGKGQGRLTQNKTIKFQRLSDPNLLKRMIRGKTQNANESLHNIIGSRCPKTILAGKHKLHGAVGTAISSFNEGAIHMSQLLKKLAIEPNQRLNIFIDDIDSIRIQKATKANISSLKRARWVFKTTRAP